MGGWVVTAWINRVRSSPLQHNYYTKNSTKSQILDLVNLLFDSETDFRKLTSVPFCSP